MTLFEKVQIFVKEKLTRPYQYYQPEDLTPEQWALIDAGDFNPFVKMHVNRQLDRICMDRATMIRNAMRLHFDPKDKTILDLGCNTGFFSHYFARVGMEATGIDSNSHNSVKGTTVDAATSVIDTANRLARLYGVSKNAHFIESEIQPFLADFKQSDVVLCLSLFHHFFYDGSGYGVREKADVDALLKLIASRAKQLMYFEIDHRTSDKNGWLEADLPKILKEKGDFKQVNIIGLSTDAFVRYRSLYECVR
ncbi:MAG: methyltransferase domain-containing protein [Patescibacteria group bacterium]